jgi:hypothetical protein
MASRDEGLVRGLVAAIVLATVATPAIGLILARPAGPIVARHIDPAARPADDSMFDLTAAKATWLDDFQSFAARRPGSLSDAGDKNVVVVAKAVPGFDAPASGKQPESVELKDMPKTPAPLDAANPDDAMLKTGSIRPSALPLLPPVPDADAFRPHKGDRLGGPRISPGTTTDATAAPHAELGPTKANAAALAVGKTASLLPARSDKLKLVVASASMKPMDLAPVRPDPLFQGPPIPPDPTIDPDAPVLGYAEQISSAEAPFKALFAVSPVARKSWLAVAPSSPAPSKAAKPSKVARQIHRTRKHNG